MSSKNHKAVKLLASRPQYPMRLDQALVLRNMAISRSRAEEYIRYGRVHVNGVSTTKASLRVFETDKITTKVPEDYVSRAGLKLSSVAKNLKLKFDGKVVLDVGSSTGGFTEFALKHGAKKIIAVDVGTDQLHPKLRGNPKIELHEKTDVRDFKPKEIPNLVLIDVSFISLRYILPHIATIVDRNSTIVAMVKPQFEAGKHQIHKGVIKNDHMRRDILKEFENWAKKQFVIVDKSDSGIAGAKGNLERFYLLKKLN